MPIVLATEEAEIRKIMVHGSKAARANSLGGPI
jgi:hypothetical protein